MTSGIPYEFKAELWQYSAPGSWHFVSLPLDISSEIRANFKAEEQGWGRLKVIAKIGVSDWKTAIWFDTKMNTYLLPIKAEIRKKEKLSNGKSVTIKIWI